jgi:hypothetical protein
MSEEVQKKAGKLHKEVQKFFLFVKYYLANQPKKWEMGGDRRGKHQQDIFGKPDEKVTL